jgi:hypothetical protein
MAKEKIRCHLIHTSKPHENCWIQRPALKMQVARTGCFTKIYLQNNSFPERILFTEEPYLKAPN